MIRYFIELAYNGSEYNGWQIQPNGVTVQEKIEDAFQKALREKVNVTGCGRTDTGVHASYFVAHFDVENAIEEEILVLNKVNRILFHDIVIMSLKRVTDDAHSRFSAVSRRYEYWVSLHKNPFLNKLAFTSRFTPDFELMNQAAAVLMEYTDFTSFSKLHGNAKTNNCKITYARWELKGHKWVFTIQADRFLRNMVRAIVGTLLEVGKGKLTIDGFRKIIEAQNRCEAGMSVPAEALYLVDVVYPPELFKRQWYGFSDNAL